MLHIKNRVLQGEPKFARWDAALKAEYAELQGQSSGRLAPKSHLDVVTDKSGLLERFESLGAILRVRHACLCIDLFNSLKGCEPSSMSSNKSLQDSLSAMHILYRQHVNACAACTSVLHCSIMTQT